MTPEKIQQIAESIANKIMWVSGVNQEATRLYPAIGEELAGFYSKTELVQEIECAIRSVLNNNDVDEDVEFISKEQLDSLGEEDQNFVPLNDAFFDEKS